MANVSEQNGIPISPLLADMENTAKPANNGMAIKKRLLIICALCIAVAISISLIAKVLIVLINIVTNFSFYGKFDLATSSPADNHLGLWVLLVPAVGGVIVGCMALWGSKAIRGHGIPEAMEQILTNQSKIKPSITFLKPISSAFAIGTGGPFGAEGPIIATGGALGSTFGQLLKITSNERKVILAAGATAGMSAIFGTPIAAVFLAIELLLFEFSPRSILPVALACITGAAGHHLLFGAGPVFPMPDIAIPSNAALAIYSCIGLVVGFLSLGVTKIVYWIEDVFEHLPIHWMWWPAIGGLAVGIIGYFAPHTLGVGYENIINVLSGTMAILIVLRLCVFKFISWAIALGSGTSGGTLAPLLTIGSAAGVLIGALILMVYPDCGINLPLAALIGMSAMFAGASRAYLTSITFALEATGQFHALLPLLGGCTAAYLVSFFLMENTIMTEKIARRGVFTPDSYEPDVLGKIGVDEVMDRSPETFNEDSTIATMRKWLNEIDNEADYFISVDDKGNYTGIFSSNDVTRHELDGTEQLKDITHNAGSFINVRDSLQRAVELIAIADVEALPVLADKKVTGLLTQQDIFKAYRKHLAEGNRADVQISLKRQRIKVLIRSKGLMNPGHRHKKD